MMPSRWSIAMMVVSAALVLVGCRQDAAKPAAQTSRKKTVAVAKADPRTAPAQRPYYRYSVVPGGVYSPKEAAQETSRDRVVADHYADVDLENLRPQVNERDRDVYVSYRVGNEIYWTKKPVRLKRNELVLTDGYEEIRTRCGNRISDVARGPVHPDLEPNTDVYDTKVDKADTVWPDAVNNGQALPMGGVLTSVPSMPNWNSDAVPAPPQGAGPGGLLATTAPAPMGGGAGGGGTPGGVGGGAGAGGGVVPVGVDGATAFNNWGGSTGSGLILVNNSGTPTPPGQTIINQVTTPPTLITYNFGGGTQIVQGPPVNTAIVQTGLNQTQTLQTLSTSNQQIVNNNTSNSTNSTTVVNNNNTTVVNNNTTVANNSVQTNYGGSTITNITNIIQCCLDGKECLDGPQVATPEPKTMMLMGFALVVILAFGRLRRKTAE
jgi:hypothetical protein